MFSRLSDAAWVLTLVISPIVALTVPNVAFCSASRIRGALVVKVVPSVRPISRTVSHKGKVYCDAPSGTSYLYGPW